MAMAPLPADLRKSIPRMQTATQQMPKESSGGQGDLTDTSVSGTASVSDRPHHSPPQAAETQRFVFTDPVAFRYLETDPSTTVVGHKEKLEGYECYIVEQWACSRTHPTFVITSYTGDPTHSVTAGVLSISAREETWSPRLKVYFKSLNQQHARRRETQLGTLMVTNLNGFPTSLTVIPVPKGDVRDYRELFLVNENLKRLGCSGRVGFKLIDPSAATKMKFHQLYRTNNSIDLNKSVIELVKLCQDALVLFAKLEPEYADGLLCDVTEKAVGDWWIEFGAEYYNVEPQDGILGPTTIAALLGMLMGARNRLNAYGAPVSKDAFDIESTKRGISYFQRAQRLPKTRRLDRQTLEKLRRATTKAANSEGWTVPRAVKSTVAELSGKGGEMVMEMVGARDKAGIADIETTDIERFIDLASGSRSKWLWHGKRRKQHSRVLSRAPTDDSVARVQVEDGSAPWLGQRRDTATDENQLKKKDKGGREERDSLDLPRMNEGGDKEYSSTRAALRRATGRMGDARSGFDRIKDVVGRRSHQDRLSKDGYGDMTGAQMRQDSESIHQIPGAIQADPKTKNGPDHSEPFSAPDDSKTHFAQGKPPVPTTYTKTLTETPTGSNSGFIAIETPEERQAEQDHTLRSDVEDMSHPPTAETSIAGSIYQGIDLDEALPVTEASGSGYSRLLQRRVSMSETHPERHEEYWPRQLSFSLAEDSVLRWESVNDMSAETFTGQTPALSLQRELALAEDAKRLQSRLRAIEAVLGQWVETRIRDVQELNKEASEENEELRERLGQHVEECEALRTDCEDTLEMTKTRLQEVCKEVDVLGAKLAYELNGLRSKMEDVEEGIADFERQVVDIESKVDELEEEMKEKESWLHWGLRVLTGLGRAPSAVAASS